MSAASFQRMFSMGAFEALRLVRISRVDFPEKDFFGVVEIVTTVQGGGAAFDYEAAFHLDTIVAPVTPTLEAIIFYRECIQASILQHRPMWVRTIPLGRRKFAQKLERDESQCFSSAGLLEELPSTATIEWWDRISAQTRSHLDNIKMAQARDAERRSLEHESARIARLGIEQKPVWMSIEDNTAGYDILSFDRGAEGSIARVLEVKSTIASPLRFFVTRNEWETCQKMGSAYHFHIWDMRTGTLFERTGTDVASHIPRDQGRGRWSNVEIKLGGDS